MPKTTKSWTVRDPFAGDVEAFGRTLEDAVADAYADVPEEERPRYVWHEGERVDVPGGVCQPVQ